MFQEGSPSATSEANQAQKTLDTLELHFDTRGAPSPQTPTKKTSGMHKKAAEKWASLEGDRARMIEAHHRSMSGDEEDIRWIESNINQISLSDSAVAAVVLENVLELEESQILRKEAASIALDRGERNEANVLST